MSTKTRQRIIIGLIIVVIAGVIAYFLRHTLFGGKKTDDDEDRPIIIRTDGAITNEPVQAFNVYHDPLFTAFGDQLRRQGPEIYSVVVTDRASKVRVMYSQMEPFCAEVPEVATILSPRTPGTPNPSITVVGPSGPMIIKFYGLKPEAGNTCDGCSVVRVTCNCCKEKALKDYNAPAGVSVTIRARS